MAIAQERLELRMCTLDRVDVRILHAVEESASDASAIGEHLRVPRPGSLGTKLAKLLALELLRVTNGAQQPRRYTLTAAGRNTLLLVRAPWFLRRQEARDHVRVKLKAGLS